MVYSTLQKPFGKVVEINNDNNNNNKRFFIISKSIINVEKLKNHMEAIKWESIDC